MLPRRCPGVFVAARHATATGLSSKPRGKQHGHRHFPDVLPVNDDPENENLMEFTDAMMQHERFNKDLRIISKAERLKELPPTKAQRAVLEQRLNRQLSGQIRAAEIASQVRLRLEEEMKRLQGEMLVGDELPETVDRVTVTHIGTLDGFDEPILPHVVLTRAKALAYEEELGMTLCVEDLSEECDEAVCRMRHLKPYLARQARMRIAQSTAQLQQNRDRDLEVQHVEFRAGIEDCNTRQKCNEVCRLLTKGFRVRIVARNCVTSVDSAEMLHFLVEAINATAHVDGAPDGKPYVTFAMGAPMFSKNAASCMLVVLAEGKPTQIIDQLTVVQMGSAVDRAEDEAFEREVSDEGEGMRGLMEESRRRKFWGVQEDFLTAKLRRGDVMDKHDFDVAPVTNHDTQQMEYHNKMREVGVKREVVEGYDGETMFGEHQWQSPAEAQRRREGSMEDAMMELSPGPDGQPREFLHGPSPF